MDRQQQIRRRGAGLAVEAIERRALLTTTGWMPIPGTTAQIREVATDTFQVKGGDVKVSEVVPGVFAITPAAQGKDTPSDPKAAIEKQLETELANKLRGGDKGTPSGPTSAIDEVRKQLAAMGAAALDAELKEAFKGRDVATLGDAKVVAKPDGKGLILKDTAAKVEFRVSYGGTTTDYESLGGKLTVIDGGSSGVAAMKRLLIP